MGITTFGLGQRCPIPAYDAVIYSTDNGPLLLWPSPPTDHRGQGLIHEGRSPSSLGKNAQRALTSDRLV